MKYLKIFENFDSDLEVQNICKKYNITNYIINSDGSIDVDGDVSLAYRSLTKLPLIFNNVYGHFDCYDNDLITLEGSPKYLTGSFDCSNNQLTTLEGSPKSIKAGFSFDCSNNKLTTLEGATKSIRNIFDCSNNQLTTLDGLPEHKNGSFYCSGNPVYHVWKLISTYDSLDTDYIELLEDYDIFREDKTIVLDRLNSFLEDIGKPVVNKVKGYKLI
jgi:hypothetical protein